MKANDSARSACRAARVGALRVLISMTTLPANPWCASSSSSFDAGLVATAGDEVLVLGRTCSVGQVDVPQPWPEILHHLERVATRSRAVGQVDGDIGIVLVDRVPARCVCLELALGRPPRIHVLHREGDPGVALELGDPLDEVAGIVTLPAKRRMHHDGVGAESA